MKKLINIFILLLLTGCFYPFLPYKPQFEMYYFDEAYAVIENGKINRMGIARNDTNKMTKIIKEKYGINIAHNRFASNKGTHKIIFLNDLKLIFNGQEYIIKKESIRSFIYPKEIVYLYDRPKEISSIRTKEYILDIGEVEIVDLDGSTIKKREKIPPILVKKVVWRMFSYDLHRYNHDMYYKGWLEDYPEDPSTLKKLYNSRDKAHRNK